MVHKRLIGILVAAAVGMTSLPAFAAKVDRRERRQQQRIDQGVQNGSLNPNEAAHLERRDAHIDREVARDRAKNGGTLTPGERRKVERQENRTSRAIYREKHN
jgi:hypothetical protein